MEFIKCKIEGLLLIKPDVYYDARGYFFESYNYEIFRKAGIDLNFVQDNQSQSIKNVLRGLHFQKPPYEQAKLVRVIKGTVIDVAVDIRTNSPTYGKYETQILSEKNNLMFYIPAGFAHGYISLDENNIFSYKCTNYYNKQSESAIRWNDPILNIDWGTTVPLLSEKDANAPLFENFISPFVYI